MKSEAQSYTEPNFLASSSVQPLLLTAMTDKTVAPGEVYVVGGQAKGIVFTGRTVKDGDNAPISVLYTGVVYAERLTGLTADYRKQLASSGVKFVEDLNAATQTQSQAPSGNTDGNKTTGGQ